MFPNPIKFSVKPESHSKLCSGHIILFTEIRQNGSKTGSRFFILGKSKNKRCFFCFTDMIKLFKFTLIRRKTCLEIKSSLTRDFKVILNYHYLSAWKTLDHGICTQFQKRAEYRFY